MDLRKISYGGTAAVVTGMGLVIGLDAAGSTRSAIVASLLIFAIADNLSDSLSIHMYQESERLEERAAFRATVANFATRLGLSVGFAAIVILLPPSLAVVAALGWGGLALLALTALVARDRGAPIAPEIAKHFAVAAVVIAASKGIGSWLQHAIG